ncbi:hypothetical protein B843_10220 [Corynebacterium vitaeruminis DSM 20294]|uniref:Uncharacterized protein n=1 Tax=Corynebacterium vitaeruminis DSM 20294 TaxID=1224164 RepID=W5Y3G5_9CORY|nr:hypothetical protein B843_10220 [Corynebacterium vitaeruminis DSM 20294]
MDVATLLAGEDSSPSFEQAVVAAARVAAASKSAAAVVFFIVFFAPVSQSIPNYRPIIGNFSRRAECGG